MNTKALIVGVLLIVAFLIGAFSLRLFKPNETTQTQNTATNSTTQTDGWQEQTVDEIGLTFKTPPGTTFRKEVGDDETVRKLVFYVQKGSDDNPEYLLYGLSQFQPDRQATVGVDIERWKAEMTADTVKNTTIGRYTGVEGLVQGKESPYVSDRTRYVKVVLKDGGQFSVSTLPPTQENKELTEQILATFDFQ